VWTYFGLVNPLKKADDPDNYRSSAVTANLEAQDEYGAPAVKRIFASWIPAFGRQVARRVNDIQLGRFRTPPRHFTYSSFRTDPLTPVLGRGYKLQSRPLQDDTGAPDSVPIQIVRLQPTDTGFEIEADELRFTSLDDGDLNNRVIIIDANAQDVNFREAHDSLYPPPVSGDEVTCIVEAGVIVGASASDTPAFTVGDWPAGVTLHLIIRGRIQGKGGDATPSNGQDGGTAIYSRYAVQVDATGGQIWGGGGGGGCRVEASGSSSLVRRWGGGGGQGYQPGLGYVGNYGTGQNATTETYGLGDSGGGRGGLAGQPGQPGLGDQFPRAGGAGGNAIDGVSFLTITGSPDIRGAQIN
jgi:hypothetical protein